MSAGVRQCDPAEAGPPLEWVAWLGLLGLVAVAVHLLRPPHHHAFGAFGPKELVDWASAISAAVGSIAAAVSTVNIVLHKLAKPKKPRRKKPKRERIDHAEATATPKPA